MRIVTVLKTGGDFRVEHVEALREQVRRHAPDVAFTCLTDCPTAQTIEGAGRLRHGWPGWWSKLEIFALRGPCIYMDLDTMVVGNLSRLFEIARSNVFTVLRDFNPHQRVMGSGLMAWQDNVSGLYELFKDGAEAYIAENKSPRWFGDQGFIEAASDAFMPPRTYWQDEAPGYVVSFKKHCAAGVPEGARVVCFHGKPRPWESRLWNGEVSGRAT